MFSHLSAKLEMENAELFVMGGGLDGVFRVAQLHFHWGGNNKRGSEHTLNGRAFPLEVRTLTNRSTSSDQNFHPTNSVSDVLQQMHVVTYNSERYTNLGDAVKGHNSLAVFGTWYKVRCQNFPAHC